MSVTPARRAAYEVVMRVFEEDAYADRAFATAAARLDPRERAFAQQIAYGTVQRVRALDHGIETLARRPVAKLDPPVRAALRIGAYQLAYLSGVARHAAVNETVELVRAARLERAVAFTNAVMRRLTVGLRDLLEGLPDGPLKLSYPDWIAELFERDFGRETALALMRAQNEPPETVVRLVRGEIDGEPTDVPGAFRVARVDERALDEGRIWPQSRGSQLAGLAVGSSASERTLDLCAAPGGKATQLAGEVVAVEKHEGRARELAANVARLGAANVRVVHADALELPAELAGFDRRPRRRALLGARRPQRTAGPPLARQAAPRSAARAAPRGRRTGQARREDRLLGLHPERRRVRGRRRRLWPGGGRSRRRLARLPAPAAARVPAHAAARPRHVGVFRRPPTIAGVTDYLQRALELAEATRGRAHPKPDVGAVVVRDGQVVGEGSTEADGRHGEIVALAAAGDAARGSTLYVTMEPCAHHGTTPPCADAIVAAGVVRVVAGSRDPNPEAAGGVERLGEGGVEVEIADSFVARAQTEAWRTWVTRGRPFVTWKVAVTLDGRVTVPGSRWVSGEESRRRVHELRARSDAVAVGMGTVRADDPRLDVRGVDAARQPRRLAFGRGPLPAGCELELRTGPIADELRRLAGEGVQSLLLEGGPTLAAAFLAEDLVDRLLVFVAPTLAGAGPRMLGDLPAAISLSRLTSEPIGEDVLLSAYVHEP